MKLKIFGGLLIAALAITSIADAQSRTQGSDRRDYRQQRNYNQSVRSDGYSRGETRNQRGDERRFNSDRHMERADNHYGRNDRGYSRQEESRNSRDTYRERHYDRIR